MQITLVSEKPSEWFGISRYQQCLVNQYKGKVKVISPFIPSWLPKKIRNVLRTYPLFVKRDKICKNNILHFTSQNQALLIRKTDNAILTVHDIIPYITNEYHSILEKVLYKKCLSKIKYASHVIVDSLNTKRDLIKKIHMPEQKITVIYPGIDDTFRYKKIKRDPYKLLYVGSEMPRKNVHQIIEALAIIKKKFPNIQLTKIGHPQWRNARKKHLKLVKQLHLTGNIIWKDYVEDLTHEYSTASVFLFPSCYEGFGFPILEAMACGCPVVCSDKSSLKEIVGDGALICSPDDPKDIAKKCINVLSDKSLQYVMQHKGLMQAKKFTWKKTAQQTWKCYEKIIRY